MKINYYEGIQRKKAPKWLGWTIIDFYNSLNLKLSEKEETILKVLAENYFLIELLKED